MKKVMRMKKKNLNPKQLEEEEDLLLKIRQLPLLLKNKRIARKIKKKMVMKKRNKTEKKTKKKMKRKLSLLLVNVVESQVKKLHQHLLKRKNQAREEERPRKLQNQMIMKMLMTKKMMKKPLKRVVRRNQWLLKNSKRDKITLISLMLSRLMRPLKEHLMISKIIVVHSVLTENYLELFIQVITLSLKS